MSALLGDRSVQLVALLVLAGFGAGFAAGPASPVGFVGVGSSGTATSDHSGHSDHSSHSAHGAGSGAIAGHAVPAAAPLVRAQLDEFTVRLNRRSVPAGPVRLVVVNRGKVEHELMVVPEATLRALGRKPDDDALHEAVTMSIHGLAPKTGKRRGLSLKRGRYVLLCNLPGHLAAGQRTTLIVS